MNNIRKAVLDLHRSKHIEALQRCTSVLEPIWLSCINSERCWNADVVSGGQCDEKSYKLL